RATPRSSRAVTASTAARRSSTQWPTGATPPAISTPPGRALMADLRTDIAGIRSPNPFWLASAPPANTGEQVMRAFDAGWGGGGWETLGEPPVNVHHPVGREA